mmetsp:Transcript_5884/g.11956  ORF Transcript_5884/g.11956 Transcript_5884/m.11956 type:complete len:83 (-) Transcript_5884:608-856(-)
MGNYGSTPAVGEDHIITPPWAASAGNVKVFFDISIKGEVIGRIEMTLADKIVPKTVENFRCLCTGTLNVKFLCYLNFVNFDL